MRTSSLISDTAKPCGVESFARGLAAGLERRDGAGIHHTFKLTGQPGEQALLGREIDAADALIVNLPMVAWKRVPFGPTLAMRRARRAGKDVILVLHEWSDLDWKRRATYAPALPYATRLVFSSPFVLRQFEADPVSRLATRQRSIVPIPPNLERPGILPRTALVEQIEALRAAGTFVLGHFGAIYPKKQSIAVLDVAAALKAQGRRVHTVFIGDFIGGSSVEPRAPFETRVRDLGLDGSVIITGYIDTAGDVLAAIEACDALAYLLPDGLTSRRGSILAGLQTTTPVLVNGPTGDGEFAHHPSFRRALSAGALTLLAPDASPEAFAAALARLPARRSEIVVDYANAWADALESVVPSVAVVSDSPASNTLLGMENARAASSSFVR